VLTSLSRYPLSRRASMHTGPVFGPFARYRDVLKDRSWATYHWA